MAKFQTNPSDCLSTENNGSTKDRTAAGTDDRPLNFENKLESLFVGGDQDYQVPED